MKRKPVGWISSESIGRLVYYGGNDSKGTVPIHGEKTAVSRFPVYLDAGGMAHVHMYEELRAREEAGG